MPAASIVKAATWWGDAKKSILLHARGIEHHTKGVENVLSCINLGLATGKFGKPGCGITTITGQGNGQGGREHGHKCDQLPGNRDITNPEHRAYVASVWGCPVDAIPGKGKTAQEIVNAIHDACGVRIDSLPVTPEKILRALDAVAAQASVTERG